jgi:hypothetical protein
MKAIKKAALEWKRGPGATHWAPKFQNQIQNKMALFFGPIRTDRCKPTLLLANGSVMRKQKPSFENEMTSARGIDKKERRNVLCVSKPGFLDTHIGRQCYPRVITKRPRKREQKIFTNFCKNCAIPPLKTLGRAADLQLRVRSPRGLDSGPTNWGNALAHAIALCPVRGKKQNMLALFCE